MTVGPVTNFTQSSSAKTELAGNSEVATKLFAMAVVRAAGRQRISSEEEERRREGYEIDTHFRGLNPRLASISDDMGVTKLEAAYLMAPICGASTMGGNAAVPPMVRP
jgi:hypothetical protein